jgi:hypothetical protein
MASSACAIASRSSCKRQPPAEIAVGFGGIRIQFDRAAEGRDRLLGAPLHHPQIAERDLPPRIAIIQLNGATGVPATGEQTVLAIDPAHMR